MGGSYESINQAYFGLRIDPYCSATPSECADRREEIIKNYLDFANYNIFTLLISENSFSPS